MAGPLCLGLINALVYKRGLWMGNEKYLLLIISGKHSREESEREGKEWQHCNQAWWQPKQVLKVKV